MSLKTSRRGRVSIRRKLLIIVASLLVAVFAFHLGGGWYFASVLNERALSGEARRAALAPDYIIAVVAVSEESITLRDPGNERLVRDGRFGLNWEGGSGTIGAITSRIGDSVTREFTLVSGSPPPPSTLVDLDGRIYPGDPLEALMIPFEDVTFEGELGTYPAWFIPGEGSTWFIFVHGNGMTRRDGLRMLPAVVEAGMPVLVPTYRNDDSAPANDNDRLTYGKEEWRDLESAVDYALANGAESVVIEGMSMGGAVVAAFLMESPLATTAVRGVILDAPMLDFEAAIEFQAKDERLPLIGLPLPFTLVNAAKYITERRFAVDWEYTNYLDRANRLGSRILLIHGTEDGTVPVASSDELARTPDIAVQYWRVEGAGHIESWNVDPEGYDLRMLTFLRQIGAID